MFQQYERPEPSSSRPPPGLARHFPCVDTAERVRYTRTAKEGTNAKVKALVTGPVDERRAVRARQPGDAR
jgi:hypothetical protein